MDRRGQRAMLVCSSGLALRAAFRRAHEPAVSLAFWLMGALSARMPWRTPRPNWLGLGLRCGGRPVVVGRADGDPAVGFAADILGVRRNPMDRGVHIRDCGNRPNRPAAVTFVVARPRLAFLLPAAVGSVIAADLGGRRWTGGSFQSAAVGLELFSHDSTWLWIYLIARSWELASSAWCAGACQRSPPAQYEQALVPRTAVTRRAAQRRRRPRRFPAARSAGSWALAAGHGSAGDGLDPREGADQAPVILNPDRSRKALS